MLYIHVPTGSLVTSDSALPSGQWRPIDETPEKAAATEEPTKQAADEPPKRQRTPRKAAAQKE